MGFKRADRTFEVKSPSSGQGRRANASRAKRIFGRVLKGAMGVGLVAALACATMPDLLQIAYAVDDEGSNPIAEVLSLGDGQASEATTYTATVEMPSTLSTEATGDATVEVNAPAGALPDGAELHAKFADETDAITQKLDEAGVTYEGYVALDVYFTDADGNEVEPTEAVDVRFELPSSMVPEGAEDVQVQHLAENADGEVVSVETVADAADDTDGTVTTSDDVLTAEFSVDGFSWFTITFTDPGSGAEANQTITVRLVDTNGNELPGDEIDFGELATVYDPADFGEKWIRNQWVSIKELAATWAGVTGGYSYVGAYRDESLNNRIYWIMCQGTTSSGRWGTTANATWYYCENEIRPSNNDTSWGAQWTTSGGQSRTLYLVFKEIDDVEQSGALTIVDTVSTNGMFTANYTGATEATYYVWQERNADGEWETITRLKMNGDEYNLTENGKAFSVVLDVVSDTADAGGGWYRVSAYESEEAYEKGETALATSQAYQLQYYDALQNGSFETPNVNDLSTGGKSNYQYPVGTEGLVWKTTGEDQQVEIVNAPNDKADGASDYNNMYGAVVGDQYAELNCQAAGALYQDVMTVPGTTLNWRFSHRGRNGNDTMYLLIAPTAAVEDVTTQDQLNQLISEIQNSGKLQGDGSYKYTNDGVTYFLVSNTQGNKAWDTVSGTYTVEDDQYLTRFFFVAGATASKDETIGNLLDNVYFTTGLLPAESGEANLQVTKVVSGVSDLESDYAVTVNVSWTDDSGSQQTETITLRNFFRQNDGTYRASDGITIDDIPANKSVQVTVTETNFSKLSDYSGPTSSVAVGDGESKPESSATVTLEEQANGSVTFTNAYERNPISLQLLKYGDDNGNGSYDPNDDSLLIGAAFTLYKDADASDNNYDPTKDIEAAASGTTEKGILTLGDIADGTYWLVETKAPAGYVLLANPVKVVVQEGKVSVAFATGSGDGVTYGELTSVATTASDGKTPQIQIGNSKIATLPSSGSSGTIATGAIGISTVVLAAGWLLRKKSLSA